MQGSKEESESILISLHNYSPSHLWKEILGQGSLVSYSPKICKESDMTERLNMNTDTHKATSAAAAKSLQSCPTLCDPIDGSPTGSPVPGIFQARTLEWVAISFSNA